MFVLIEGPDSPTFLEDRDTWILNAVYLVFGCGAVGFLQKYLFKETGENLTYEVRTLLFESTIYKQVSWFDRKDKAPGILSVVFSEDITNLNGLSTETISVILETFFCLVGGVALSAFFQWRMSVICIISTPFVMLGGVLMSRLKWKTGPGGNDPNVVQEDPYDKSNALLSDVITNYRTVISFGQDNVDSIMDKYEHLLTGPAALRVRNAHIAGFAFGYSMCIRVIYIGVVFFIGSKLVRSYDLDTKDVFMSIYIIFTSAMGAGFAMASIPSATEARESAQRIFKIIDEPSKIDVRQQAGKLQKVTHGAIEFQNVTFNYPTRQQQVLKNFSMTIPAGKKIGLVGHSGCGKSTITNLLLRFYELQQGEIRIDGEKIEDYDVAALRRQIGYVMQEPILFNQTIKENILFGKSNSTDAQVRQYAEMANALQFIESNFEELDEDE